MRKIKAFLLTSLDGYYEGEKAWEIDWHNVDDEFNELAMKQLDAAAYLVFGRATYQGMAGYWPTADAVKDDPEVASRMNGMPKIVVSRTLESTDVTWSNSRLVRDADELAALKAESGKDLLVLGSSVLTTALMELGLVDELGIMVNPVILGAGNSLSSTAKGRIPLKLLGTRQFRNGNVLLTYEPRAISH
ncbi:MAG: dihydrofolate reductase [Chloroflexi bacterium]|nr:MAG: dihydrofolate reductase [Chloroflexota bacterium]